MLYVVLLMVLLGLGSAASAQTGSTDYSSDGSRIDVSTAEQLNAMRWDLDGDGVPVQASRASYSAAFPDAAPRMGCASTCTGYVLRNDIDLSVSRWSSSSTEGWAPIGGAGAPYIAQFDGDGHVVRNLFINRGSQSNIGLFGQIGKRGRIEGLGLSDAVVTGGNFVGALAGQNEGEIIGSHAIAAVSGGSDSQFVGGLAGYNFGGVIRASYAIATVRGNTRVGGLVGWNAQGEVGASYAIATVNGSGSLGVVGGLMGGNAGTVRAGYAIATVRGNMRVGGLLGSNNGGTVTASYTIATVSGSGAHVGALVGFNLAGTITDSYWDSDVSDLGSSVWGVSKTTIELQTPIAATGIYSTWDDVDVDGDNNADEPWDFGTDKQYPVLRYGGLSTATQLATQLAYDARLQSITISPGTLAPVFDGNVTSYTAVLNRAVSVLTVTATAAHSSASVVFSPADADEATGGHQVRTSDVVAITVTSSRGNSRRTYTLRAAIDYSSDGSRIDVRTAEQLNAMRWDLDGNGNPDLAARASYSAAFPNAMPRMGCDSACKGYVLRDDIDLGVSRWSRGSNNEGWAPIGTENAAYDAPFDGAGHVVRNLYINRSGQSYIGLFGRIFSDGRIERLGLIDAVVTGNNNVGALVGWNNRGKIIDSHAIATVSGNTAVGGFAVGGLVGDNTGGEIRASYAIANVVGNRNVGGLAGYGSSDSKIRASYAVATVSVSGIGNGNVGGLLGFQGTNSEIRASYAIATVRGRNNVGGLVGNNFEGTVIASYAVATATATATGGDGGGLVGSDSGDITVSYWDTDVSGLRSSAGGTSKTTSELQTPTAATGIYSTWDDVDVDGDNNADEPWNFGTHRQYPVLQYGGLSTATQFAAQSANDARLRSLTLSQGTLAPVFDGNVTGYTAVLTRAVSVLTVTATAAHSSAAVVFSPADADETTGGHQVRMADTATITVTSSSGRFRKTYTLRAAIDYSSDDTLIDVRTAEQLNAMRWDLNGDGMPTVAGRASYSAAFPDAAPRMGCASICTGYVLRGDVDLGVSLWGRSRGGAGWAPIGADGAPYAAEFDGAGRIVRNLYINRGGLDNVGLFGNIGEDGSIKGLGVVNADVTGRDFVGALAGSNSGEIIDSHASATVTGNRFVGGLAGSYTGGKIRASYAIAAVSGDISVGGLAGFNERNGEIRASYAVAAVRGDRFVGGLAGASGVGEIAASYAIATVSGDISVGGLAGSNSGMITASYWDTDVSGLITSAGGAGKTTSELRTPTAATGIYLTWDDVDVDGDDNADEPWDFGTDRQYPVLRYGVLSTATQFAAQLANDAGLRSLTLSPGVLQPAFDGGVTGYTALVDAGVSVLTVTATAAHSSASVVFSPADADEATGGHQVRTADAVAITVTSPSGRFQRAYTLRLVIDYSSDDGRIDVRTAEQLNAMRWDLDGDGVPAEASSASYSAAFPGALPGMGCASTCTGYVLRGDVDLGVSRWGRSSSTQGWAPIGARRTPYTARFDGAGRVVRNLFINRSGESNIGLFGRIAESGRVERLGLIDAVVVGSDNVGGLAGYNEGEIIDSHASATVTGNRFVGGLAGFNTNGGEIRASYAVATVNSSGSSVGGLAGGNTAGEISASYAVATVNSSGSSVGGLAGGNTAGEIRASYAIATVNGSSSVGGLAGDNGTGGIAASYAVATVSGDSNVGGLAGSNSGMITDSYWDTDVSGLSTSAGGTSKTTIELRTPTAATGIYLTWDDVDVDGDDNADEPWDFGTDRQYPVLRYGVLSTATQFATQLANDADLRSLTLSPGVLQPAFDGGVTGHVALVDTGVSVLTVTATAVHSLASVVFFPADADEETGGHQVRTTATVVVTVTSSSGRFRKTYTLRVVKVIDYSSDDGRIDVRTAEQLNAMRWDLDGDGVPVQASSASYSAVFPDAAPRMGCASTCTGYVLRGDVDLGVSRWGRSRSNEGWAPIGADGAPYAARFDGAGRVVRNLFINRSGESNIGLFGRIAESGRIERLGLIDAVVIGRDSVGALAGSNQGEIIDSHASVTVGGDDIVGGLVGSNTRGKIRASYAIATVSGDDIVGGLVGFNDRNGEIRASYAVAAVNGSSSVGGLAGDNGTGGIAASYAVATVSGDSDVGGLAGSNSEGSITASYWDTDVSGLRSSAGGTSKTTIELRTPTAATGIYLTWDDVDVDGDDNADEPWDFGTDRQYPVLRYGVLSTATQFATQLANDADLRSLTLSPGVLQSAFDGGVTGHTALVDAGVSVLTVTATAAQSSAAVVFSPADADEETGGHQVRTTATVAITVTSPSGRFQRAYTLRLVIDYSSDDGRIDVRTAEQLNAMRWDLDGDGVPAEASSASYSAAFPDALPGMGCASTCTGYVLRNDIDLGVSRWGSSSTQGWAPIGTRRTPYVAQFDGAGRVVRNLFISRSGENNIGLFGRIAESGRVERLRLINAVVIGGDSVGALAGSNSGEIIDSHASATVTGNRFVGGLAGFNTNGGEIRASYAVATVNSSGSSVGGLAGGNTAGEIRASYAVATVNSSGSSVGGLAGDNTAGEIRASYAIATVNGSSSVGGLAGDNGTGGIAASYAVATVSGDSNVGGLAGSNSGMITDSYWDTDVSGLSTSAGGAGKTTIELRTPTAATGIYLTWDDVDVDGDDNADEPWDFGTDRQYPVLRYGVLSTATQFATQLANDADLRSLTLSPGVLQPAFDGEVTGHVALVDTGVSVLTVTATAVHSLASVVFSPEDADEEAGGHQVRTTDTVVAITVTSSSGRFRKTYTLRVVKVIDYSSDDGRIDVRTAEQLNAMRWDLDGDGVPTEASSASYSAAFPDAAPRMGCASTCTGYVLRSDIDLGVSRWGRSRRNEGWAPIGADGAPYAARFDGAGRVVRNLFINRSGESNIGLFGRIAESGRVERLGLIDAVVVGSDNVGGLAGYNEGGIIDSHASATVTGNRFVGGLAGFNTNGGEIRASYAVATVNSSGSSVGGLAGGNTAGEISASYAIATVNGSSSVGGLAGNNTAGEIRASYAIATVNGSSSVGGLAGDNGTGGIAASYAVATVSGDSNVGGLAGSNSEGSITASYWDTDVSGLRSSAGGAGKTTIELRTPTAATGIYSTWDDVDVDGDDNADEPWDFGTDRQYPVLRYGVLSTATQFATQLANDADLRSLTLSPGVLQPAFDGGVTGHVALVDTGVSVLTVTATAVHSLASVVFFPADADEETGGHQVRTTATVVVTVTSSSGRFRKTYTLRVVKVIDYSSDDGRIDVRTAEQLNAMRWDLDGDGVPVQASSASYSAAFPDAAPRMGCASTCTGYVLRNDIDLGVSRWGRSNSTTGWVPIGDFRASYDAHFDGAGRVVRNLFINRDDGSSDFGLFGRVGGNGRIEGLGLADAFVIGANLVGALAGTNLGEIIDSHAIATVSGSGEHVGGLVGYNFGGVVRASYAVATVSGQRNIGGLVGYNVSRAVVAASYAITTVDSDLCAGGLVGLNSNGQIRASYAIATVDGDRCAGGLVGDNDRGAVVAASYAVATVGGNSEVGGLAGENSGNIEASYWDTDVSGLFLSAGGTSKTTSELQTPTTAAGIYSTWDDVDVDGDTEADDPWDFGTNRHYPVLQYGGLSTATQFVAQPGNNASLQSLVLSQGALTPAFDGEVTSYTAIMGNEVSLLTVTATAVQDSASVAYSPADEDETAGGHQVGPTATVVITVTSLNQTDERSYAVALTQAPFSDLDLTSLVLSAGALAPGFTGALTDYRAEVSVSSLTVTAGFSQAASATVNGNALTSGQPSDGVALALGVNTLAIKVGAGGATKTYTVSVTRTIDYDDDGDGLLSVTTLEQLNAIRWDLDGDGRAFGPGYVAAFPYAATGMGCPSSGCMGYELDADLDFDTDNNGVVNADDGALSWGAGADAGGGWLPVNNFAATFMGNGRVISNLFISRGESSRVGLFGRINAGGKVEGLGLADAVVAGKDFVGGLAGENAGEIIGSYAIATVSGGSHVGGLVGLNNAGAVGASYAIATVSGGNLVGGLVGRNANGGGIRACYVIAAVDDGNAVGGLVGWNDGGAVAASYVVATVSGDDNVSGLAGANAGMITDSYYDTDVSGLRSGAEGTTKTTVELQTPTNYAGIYSEWNVDVDGDNDADDPWDFGTDRQYPVLQYGDLSTATQFVAQLGSATNLRSLTLSQGVLAPSLDGAITSYAALFVNTESSVLTVTATAAHSSASVAFSPADADEATGGHQVRTTAIVTITVTAPDRLARKIYTLRVLTADNDYSSDGTLIDVRTAEQLNAMRWDPDGDGVPVPADTLSYFAVFPNPLPRMGCASTCTGYVLRGDVDLGLSRWGRSRSTQGWAPIGARRTPYTARFDGAGHVVRNLFISRSGQSYIGLFGRIGGSGRIERLRLIDAVVIGGDSVGALAGSNQGEIIDSHASASVSGNVGVGGLVGDNTNGEIRASYAVATVNSYGSSVGGLAGNNTAGEIRASYAIATVNGSSSVGGLAGDNGTGGIAASYAVATVSGDSDVGGLAGSNSEGSITASYWDTDVSGLRSSAGGTSKTTIELRTPTAATGIYLTWDDVDVDGDDNADEPWDFGTDRQYPVLRYGVLSTATQFAAQLANDADLRSLTLSPGVLQPAFDGEVTGHTALVDTGVSVLTVTATAVHSSAAVVFSLADADEEAGGHQVRTTDTVVAITVTSSSGRFRKTYTLRVVKVIDYSSDDGRIDVRTAEQLNAMRWDLDGDGVPTEASSASYSAVFPDAAPRMGCASTCTGYVLRSDIDLGVSRWGRSRRNEGWAPIGADGAPYAARFDGAGRVVRNLFINRSGENNIGLFGRIAESGRIERLGLIDAVVVGSDNVGGLAGYNEGEIIGSHASATVTGNRFVGGLAGLNTNGGEIRASYAVATVNSSGSSVGGLAGGNTAGEIRASYAIATVNGSSSVGGLAGDNGTGGIAASYAIATVSGDSDVGGLAGSNSGMITDSYWDTDVSGLRSSAGGTSKTTIELRTPTAATGIYLTWDDVDVDGDDNADEPWDFGTDRQYPVLRYGVLSTATQFATQLANDFGTDRQYPVLRYGVLSTATQFATQLANDADLRSLTLSPGVLQPAFDGGVTGHTALVDTGVSVLTVTATAVHSLASVVFSPADADEETGGHQVRTTATVVVTVTSSSGRFRKTYTLRVVKVIDYSSDDGRIDVRTAEQLNAMRWDLDGDGVPTEASSASYSAVFPDAAPRMGCASTCTGYVLRGDVDLGVSRWGRSRSTQGWAPIGARRTPYTARFDGAGHVVRNLFISRSGQSYIGLFGRIAESGRIEGLGLINAVVIGGDSAGALAGSNSGEIIDSHAIASVSGNVAVGGLVGDNTNGEIRASYAIANVVGDRNVGGLAGYGVGDEIKASYAVATVGGVSNVGGLAGFHGASAEIRASYAVATVGGGSRIGGLVGNNAGGEIAASYAVATVGGGGDVGGLAGLNSGRIAASYWDTDVSGLSASAGGAGKTTRELQTPTTAAGIYSTWDDVDVDGDNDADDPWDFGTDRQYPVLQYGVLSTATQLGLAMQRAAQPFTDASLRSLTLSQGVLAPPFDGAITSYTVLVSERVPVLTVAAIAAQSAASVAYSPADADETTGGYQLRTTDAVVITVTAPNGLARRTYALSVTRGGLPTVNVTVRPKVFLQGAYDRASGRMKTTYKELLPALSPYGAVRDVDLSGLLNGARFGLSAVTDTVVDWVLVELRATTHGIAAATSSTVRDRRAALLLSDGRVVGVNPGAASPPAAIALGHVALSISEDDLIDGNDLYLLIRHRNHLPVMTTATGGGGCETDYCADFTRRQSWQDGQHDMGGGFYAMFAGDADRDGDIDFDDEAAIRRHNLTAVTGGGQYTSGVVNGDLDFDGDVLSSDRLFILINGARRACAVCYP